MIADIFGANALTESNRIGIAEGGAGVLSGPVPVLPI
jgi:hypothetical protein